MTKKKEGWFNVNKDGLKALQLGKPKSYIIRELVANAWDENMTICKIDTTYSFTRDLTTKTCLSVL